MLSVERAWGLGLVFAQTGLFSLLSEMVHWVELTDFAETTTASGYLSSGVEMN